MVVEQNNYLIKIVNVYIVYDLDVWSRNPTNNFKFKNCLFRATNIVKNRDKEKYVSSGCRMTFDNAGSWSFVDAFARNVIIFGVDNSSSSHFDNHENIFLILGESPTYSITWKLWIIRKKKFSLNFTKANTNLCLSWDYNADNNYLFVNGKEIFKFKADNKNVNFPTRFCLGSISGEFSATARKVSLNGNVYDFSVNYNSIDKSDIFNIYKHLMTENNIKWCQPVYCIIKF